MKTEGPAPKKVPTQNPSASKNPRYKKKFGTPDPNMVFSSQLELKHSIYCINLRMYLCFVIFREIEHVTKKPFE